MTTLLQQRQKILERSFNHLEDLELSEDQKTIAVNNAIEAVKGLLPYKSTYTCILLEMEAEAISGCELGSYLFALEYKTFLDKELDSEGVFTVAGLPLSYVLRSLTAVEIQEKRIELLEKFKKQI